MTSADTDAMTALHELLDERQRYEGWIQALEGRRATTPAHVFDRVHTDYTLRLERVLQRLSERTGQLQTSIEELAKRLDALKGREAERTDARQEAELRAAVGEFGGEEWERVRGEADRDIEAIAEERRGVEAELAELRRIVELTQRGSDAEVDTHDSDRSVAPTVTPSALDTVSSATQSDDASGTVDARGSSEAPGQTDTRPDSALHLRPAAPGDAEPPSIDEFIADRPVRQTQPPPETAVRSQGDGVARVLEVEGTTTAGTRDFQTVSSAPAGASLEASAAEPRRDQGKTLACPECGTLNYATEWYCERCGGELATF